MPRAPRYLPADGYDPADAKRRIRPILRALTEAYPAPETALHHRNAFELVVATILSAQSTDAKVNEITPQLFKRYPTPRKLAGADPADVEKLIYSTGFYRQKTKAIVGAARTLVERFDGKVPLNIADLTTLPGVARKTANVVISSMADAAEGIFVDTHVRRVSQRLALTPHDDPGRIEQDLMALIPRRDWAQGPHQMIQLGRGPCEAKRPRHDECPLLKWCPTGKAALGAT